MTYLIIGIVAYLIIRWLITPSQPPAKTITQIEREQRLILREQERQCREVERLAREQEKQAAQLAKHEKQIQDLYYKVEKCEDEIVHFTDLADTLTAQRDAMLAEIKAITKRLNRISELDALTADSERFHGADGAIRYMEIYASALDDQRTAKQKKADAVKLEKRRETLKNKVIVLNNKIFAAEQKVKKAVHEKDNAEKALSA